MGSLLSELYARQTGPDSDTRPSSTGDTNELVGDLIWQNNRQQRITTVVTISFNILAAFLVIASIFFDGRRAPKGRSTSRKLFQILSTIHPAETFPLIVSSAIAVQGVIFLGTQAAGLRSPSIDNCQVISQVVWPAFWIVAYTLFVFGIEVAVRGFRRKRFQARGKWTVPVCWSIVLTLLIATWVPSQANKNPRNECTATLLSWAVPWNDMALFLNSVLLFSYILTGSLIAYQLSRTAKIDRNERIAASRTVYYLAIGIILMAAVFPFWIRVAQKQDASTAAHIATIAVNIFGLLTGLLYLALRANSYNMAFRPNAASWEQKQQWRLFGSPDIDIGRQITNPIGPERRGTLHELVLPSKEKIDFDAHTQSPSDQGTAHEKRLMLSSPPSYRAPPVHDAKDPSLISPSNSHELPHISHLDSGSQTFNQASYTLFPHASESGPTLALNGTDAQQSKPVTPPKPLFFSAHARDNSDFTTATVQIGMRFSGVSRTVTYPPVTGSPQRAYARGHTQTIQRSLDGILNDPGVSVGNQPLPRHSTPHEILFRLNSNEELSPQTDRKVTLEWPRPLDDLVSPTGRISSWRKFRDKRMKSLPPVPVTPTALQPPSSNRASSAEPRTPTSPADPIRASQERVALSVALKEDEEWPLHGVSTVVLPQNSFFLTESRSWI